MGMGDHNGDVLDMWCQAMRAAARSERTIKSRRDILRASHLDIVTCDIWQIEAWLATLGHCTRGTRRTYLDAVKAAVQFAHARGLRPDDPTVGLLPIRVPKGRPRPISSAQLRLLLSNARTRRMRAYLLLGAFAGARVDEMAHLQAQDVDCIGGTITLHGKGAKTVTLPLHPAIAAHAHAMPKLGWWFPSKRNPTGHVSGNNISCVVSAHMRRNGIPGTAHQLRHFFGTGLVAVGTQARVVQELMRHGNLQNVQVYTEVTDEQMRTAIERLSA